MSNIIRHGHTAQREARPFLLREASDDALYQSTWGEIPSAVIRDGESRVTAHTFRLLGVAAAATPEADSPSAPADNGTGHGLLPPAAPVYPEVDMGASAALPGQSDPAGLILEAQAAAERCIAEAQTQAAALQAQAYDEGFRQGEAAGKNAISEQFTTALASFLQATEDITSLRAEVLRLAEADIITLAFHIARKIIHQEVRCPRDILAATLQQALLHVVDREQVVVRVHPADLDLASSLVQDLRQKIDGLRQLTVEGDPTVGRGGCVVASAFGEIDARLEAQFEELEQRFREQCRPLSEGSGV